MYIANIHLNLKNTLLKITPGPAENI